MLAQGMLWSVWVGKGFTWMPDQTLLYSPKQLVVNDLPPAPNLSFKGKVKFGDVIKSWSPAPWQSSTFRKSGEGRAYIVLCCFAALSILTAERKGTYNMFDIKNDLNYFRFDTDNVSSMIKWFILGTHWVPWLTPGQDIMIIYIKKNILYDLIWMNVRAKSQVIVTEAIKIFILCHWKESNSFMKLWGI